MDKPKPHDLKQENDIELTASGSEALSIQAPTVVPSADAENIKQSDANASALPAAPSATQQAIKRRADDAEFYAQYVKRQRRIRIRFAAIALSVVALIMACIWQTLKSSERASAALLQLPTALGTACVGEKDLASYQMSQLWYTDAETPAATINARKAILDKSIAELSATNKSSIFANLGAEVMLMQHGKRAEGLEYGQKLINIYPDLPSNYFIRAKADSNEGNFQDAVKDYEQAADLLKRQPNTVGKAWMSELPKAVWTCLNTGKIDEAESFLQLFKKYGGEEDEVLGLRAQIPLALAESLDAKDLENAGLLTKALAKVHSKLLDESSSIAQSYYSANSIDLSRSYRSFGSEYDKTKFAISLQRRDNKEAREIADSNRYYKSYWAPLAAQLALRDKNPQAAIDALDSARYRLSPSLHFLLMSQALAQQHRWNEALEQAQRGLTQNRYDDKNTGKYTLPLRLSKARIFLGMQNYQQALDECDRVIEINPILVEPRLLKIRALEALGKSEQVAVEQRSLDTVLKNFLKYDHSGGKS